MTPADEQRIIVVAPTGRDADLIYGLLVDAGLSALVCPTVIAALGDAETAAGALVVADEALDLDAVRRFAQFRAEQPPWSDLPIIVLTRKGILHARHEFVSDIGQVSIIERPVGRRSLLTVVQTALRAPTRQYQAREQLAALQKLSEELHIANSLKDELLGLVSHELRTPLTGILGCASILRRHSEILQEQDRDTLLGDINDHAVRLQRIIENMLILSRAESSPEPTAEPTLLQRTLPAVLERMRPLRGSRELELNVAEDLPPVNANRVFVEQVVGNLVRNSEKYAAPGEPVEVTIEPRGEHVAITVADHGPELSTEQVRQMFEPFYRGPKHELTTAGIGLGLPVCKRLTEVQGGTIEARPRRGGGLEVTVAFDIVSE